MTEDQMVGWHHLLDGHEFEQALGVGDGQGSLACCSPWDLQESDTTEQLNLTEEVECCTQMSRGCEGDRGLGQNLLFYHRPFYAISFFNHMQASFFQLLLKN